MSAPIEPYPLERTHRNRLSSHLTVLCLGAVLGLATLPAAAGNPDKQENTGCADFKSKSYDCARPNAEYRAGCNACKGD